MATQCQKIMQEEHSTAPGGLKEWVKVTFSTLNVSLVALGSLQLISQIVMSST